MIVLTDKNSSEGQYAACVFPRCVDGEQPSYCGRDCDRRATPYIEEFAPRADPPASRRRERTLAVTWGPWGGFYKVGHRGDFVWRVCLGWVAFTYVAREFSQVLKGWLDSEDASRG